MATGQVDIERLVENELGLAIIGSTPRGAYRLPRGRLAELRILSQTIVVSSDILDSFDKTRLFRQIIAHEAAHFVLHKSLASQPELPFSRGDERGPKSTPSLTFTRSKISKIETEAHGMGAFLLLPRAGLLSALEVPVASYLREDFIIASAFGRELELAASQRWRSNSIESICERLNVPQAVAVIALDHLGWLARPTSELIRMIKEKEVRKTNLP